MEKKSLRVVVLGPESTGKSLLAKTLADHFGGSYISEYARTYLEEKGPDYTLQDLDQMVLGQKAEMNIKSENHLIFDTDLLNLYLWKREKYGIEDLILFESWKQHEVDLFLLCDADVPWIYDPLRESEDQRSQLFNAHLDLLKHCKKKYALVQGGYEERTEMAIRLFEQIS